jgi:hypothetical protein
MSSNIIFYTQIYDVIISQTLGFHFVRSITWGLESFGIIIRAGIVLLSCLEHLQQWIVSLNWRRKNDTILLKFIVAFQNTIALFHRGSIKISLALND